MKNKNEKARKEERGIMDATVSEKNKMLMENEDYE